MNTRENGAVASLENFQSKSTGICIDPPPAPINTLAIFRKLKRYEQLKKMNELLVNIDTQEKIKHRKTAPGMFMCALILGIPTLIFYVYAEWEFFIKDNSQPGPNNITQLPQNHFCVNQHQNSSQDIINPSKHTAGHDDATFGLICKIIVAFLSPTLLFIVLISLSIGIFFDGMTALNKGSVVGRLSNVIQEELAKIFHATLTKTIKIERIIELLERNIISILEDKKMLSNMRFSFLMSVNRIIEQSLPKVISQVIFHNAELILHKPMDQSGMVERRFAFLMGREDENSNIPSNLPDEAVYQIFNHAGMMPPRLPPCFTEMSTASLFKPQLVGRFELISNEKLAKAEFQRKQNQIEELAGKYHKPNDGIVEWQLPAYFKLKESCFTFFSGRDDERSDIPWNTTKEIFLGIYSHAGLFSRELAIKELADAKMQMKENHLGKA